MYTQCVFELATSTSPRSESEERGAISRTRNCGLGIVLRVINPLGQTVQSDKSSHLLKTQNIHSLAVRVDIFGRGIRSVFVYGVTFDCTSIEYVGRRCRGIVLPSVKDYDYEYYVKCVQVCLQYIRQILTALTISHMRP